MNSAFESGVRAGWGVGIRYVMRSATEARRRRMAKAIPSIKPCRHCGHTQIPHFTHQGDKVCAACLAQNLNHFCDFEEDAE